MAAISAALSAALGVIALGSGGIVISGVAGGIAALGA